MLFQEAIIRDSKLCDPDSFEIITHENEERENYFDRRLRLEKVAKRMIESGESDSSLEYLVDKLIRDECKIKVTEPIVSTFKPAKLCKSNTTIF